MPSKVMFYDKHGSLKAIDEILSLSLEGRLTVLTSAEYEVHEGHAFTFVAVDSDMANAATVNVAFKTCHHAGGAHFYVAFSTLVGGSCVLLEAPTWTANTGTATAIINRARQENPIQSSFREDKTVAGVFTYTNKVLVNVTDLAGGTALWTRYAWGEKGKVEAGDYRAENEFLLKCDTQYAVLFTAIGAANKGQIVLNWIEHDVGRHE